ncbi:MAG: hypothetical protein FJX72_12670, partial [Armatimonadetes bacterium]|nr:hypothetical protein [Armatimonadota bacterium]
MRCVGGRDAHGACREAHNEGGWEPVRVFFGGRCRRCGARARFTHAAVCAATAVIGAALYGLLNDQATVSPAPEYFVVIKHREFASLLSVAGLSDAPLRVQAALVGLMGSWWFGVVAGIPLSVAATIGPSAPATMRAFLKAAGVVMACAACASVRCYAGAFVAQPHLAMEHYEWLAL